MKLYMKRKEMDYYPDTDAEDQRPFRKKGDVTIYVSIFNRRPGPDDYDFKM